MKFIIRAEKSRWAPIHIMSLVISLVTSSYLKPPQTLSAVIDLPYPTLFCPRRRLPKTLRPSCNTSRKVASVAVTHLTTTRNAAVHPKGLKFVISPRDDYDFLD